MSGGTPWAPAKSCMWRRARAWARGCSRPLDDLFDGIGFMRLRRAHELLRGIALRDQATKVRAPAQVGHLQIGRPDLEMAAGGNDAPEHDLVVQHELAT